MKKIRVLRVDFTETISQIEIAKFRGSVIRQVSAENRVHSVLFHNHLQDGSLRLKYPLIQYKRNREKAQIICLDAGVDDVNQLFTTNSFEFQLGNRLVKTEIENIHLKLHVLQIWDRSFSYKIKDWLALNQKNYSLYKDLTAEDEKQRFLENIMKGNILSMAKGLDWTVDKKIEVQFKEIERSKTLRYRDADLIGFDVTFKCNVNLPDFAGIGKGSSIGFGIVKQLRDTIKNES